MVSNPYAAPSAPVSDPPADDGVRPLPALYAVRIVWSALGLGTLQLVMDVLAMARSASTGSGIAGTIVELGTVGLAPPAGVEPTTYRLGGGRSIH
jgi:hypothetical protein